ncbi:MAG TPA: DUF4339 domain-containing protein [Pyrinomonadaceae bacterium]|nr:DUF4339 domain-containing protein [Pyrinomonadaceae bacterium]
MIYIYKNNARLGPYEEEVVLDKVRVGDLSPDDMAVRHGESEWKPLRVVLPASAAGGAMPASSQPAPAAKPSLAGEPQSRNTLIPKALFGLCFLGALLFFAISAYFLYSYWGSSGNLMSDLSRVSYRVLFRNAVIGTFVGGFFTLLALLLTFKSRLIQSNGLRLAIRVLSVLLLLAGLGNFLIGAGSYLTYSAPSTTSAKETNELLKALEDGQAAVGPYEMAVILMPIGAGLFLLGVSGLLMTKRPSE